MTKQCRLIIAPSEQTGIMQGNRNQNIGALVPNIFSGVKQPAAEDFGVFGLIHKLVTQYQIF